MPRCDWCGHEHADKWLYRLDKHPDRPLVCIDERACIRREMANIERKAAEVSKAALAEVA